MRICTRLRANATAPPWGKAIQQCQCRLASTQQQPTRSPSREEAKAQTRASLTAHINQSLRDGEHSEHLELHPDKRTVTTVAGDLPISPVMDPAWMEAKQRFRTPKPKAHGKKDLGRFRKKLAQNPYAHALATPWRFCHSTESGMPRYFLQEFQAVSEPTTGAPWWVPGDLMGPVSDQNNPHTAREADTAAAAAPAPTLVSPNATGEASSSRKRGMPSPPKGYIVAQMEVLRQIGGPRSQSALSGTDTSMVSRRLNLRRAGFIGKLIWRPDMHEFILGNMRRQIVDQLQYLARLSEGDGRSYLTPCASWGDINRDLQHRGCVLWRSGPARDGHLSGGEAPGQHATLDIPDAKYEKKLPVHNLDRLLGEEHLSTLLESSIFRDNTLLVLGKKRTIPLQLSLWKLQGYLAESSPS